MCSNRYFVTAQQTWIAAERYFPPQISHSPASFYLFFFSPKGTIGLLTARLLLQESPTLTHVRD